MALGYMTADNLYRTSGEFIRSRKCLSRPALFLIGSQIPPPRLMRSWPRQGGG